MPFLLMALSWAKGFTLREWLEAGAAVAIVVFILFWDHSEIQKGRDECQAAQVKQNNAFAKQLDALRAANNPLVIQRHQLDEAVSHVVEPPVPASSDCAPLDLVRLRSAHSPH